MNENRFADRAGLIALTIAAFVSIAAMRACDPLLPALALSFRISTGDAAQTISSFALAYGLLQLVYGPLGDRYGKFRVIACAVLGCTIGNALAAFSGSFEALLLARTLSGATAAGIIPLALAWIGDAVSYQRRQEVLGHLLTATLLGGAFGPWMAGMLADTVGWRWVFAVTAGMFCLLGVQMLRMARGRDSRSELAQRDRGFVRGLRAVFSVPWARFVLLITAIEGAFAFAAVAFIPASLHEAFGISLKWAAAIVALYAVGGLIYSARAGVLVKRFGEAGLVLIGSGLLALAYALITFAGTWIWAIPSCLIAGLGFSMLHGTLQTHATQMTPAVRGTAVSLFATCIFLGQSLGVLAAAFAVDHIGFRVVFVVAAVVIAVLGLAFARALVRRGRTVGEPLPGELT